MRLCAADAVVTVSSMFGCPNVFAYLLIGRFSEYGLEAQPCQRIHRVHLGSTLHVRGHFKLLTKYQLKRVIFHKAVPQPARKMNITVHRAVRAFPLSVM